ncbi:hypothetical protein P7K49_004915, partial [Saguinus oedipus]
AWLAEPPRRRGRRRPTPGRMARQALGRDRAAGAAPPGGRAGRARVPSGTTAARDRGKATRQPLRAGRPGLQR